MHIVMYTVFLMRMWSKKWKFQEKFLVMWRKWKNLKCATTFVILTWWKLAPTSFPMFYRLFHNLLLEAGSWVLDPVVLSKNTRLPPEWWAISRWGDQLASISTGRPLSWAHLPTFSCPIPGLHPPRQPPPPHSQPLGELSPSILMWALCFPWPVSTVST